MRPIVLGIVALLAPLGAAAQDNGDGTYTNPPLHADYPDPDIIRVGEDFYFASTTFVNSPGLVILHSKDLVNWETAGYVIDRLEGDPKYDMAGRTSYRNGVFAPSLRYRNGTFYVAVTPNGKPTRIYSTQDVRGPWKHQVLNDSVFDPGLFFDDDGTLYLFTSGGWDGQVSLKTLSPELDRVTATRKLFYVKGIEGSKAFKIHGWYYLFNSLPARLALMCSRARQLDGPWETIQVLDDRSGGHQGAIVDLPDGSWYGFVMRDSGPIGRVTNLCPITWKDEWPLWGEPEVVGRVPARAKKPIEGQPARLRPISTEFDQPRLNLDWQWNHNPDDARWSLTERPGYLRLKPTVAPDFWHARNSLSHKGWGPTSGAVATLDITHVQPGDVAGLGMIGKSLVTLAVQRATDGSTKLVFSQGVESQDEVAPTASAGIGKPEVVHLALQMDFGAAKGRCGYSLDGKDFTAIGAAFPLLWDWRTGTFQGQQYAVFCYNPRSSTGYLDVDSIRFDNPQLKEPVTPPSAATGPVAFESFSYSGTDPLATSVGDDSFLNPMLAGMYPDPSVCRVGDNFYLVNSTFAYFPGIPIFHSRDLVHWVQVGNAIHRPAQAPALTRTNVSGGMFAPTIRHHEGKFSVICTQVGPSGGNFLVTAERAEGPWSDPIWLRGIPGIDPSLFFDDGKTYVVFNAEAPENKPLYDGHRALWLQQIEIATGTLIGARHLLVNGGTDLAKKPIWIEGPHVLKKDGWYVLIAAEGGTGPNHSEVVFRSRELLGPYVPFEGNPILTQRDLPPGRDDPITCTGHADLVELPCGDWWAVFLGCRPDRAGHGLLGRETFLLPVRWADGWPLILDRGVVVPRVVKRPSVPEDKPAGWKPTTGTFTVTDEFTSPSLDPAWMGLRIPSSDWWTLDAAAGELRMTPRKVKLTSRGEDPSFLGRRQQHAAYTARISLRVDEGTADCDAGLAVFQDEGHHVFIGVRARKGAARELFLERTFARGQPSRQEAAPEVDFTAPLPEGSHQVELEARGEGTSLAVAYRVAGQQNWSSLPNPIDATLLSGQTAGGFTGVVIGLHARSATDAALEGNIEPLTLRYDAPAVAWNQALPVGNGRLGAMVFGGTAEERLQVNEDTVWAGEPHDYAHKDAVKSLPEIRRLLFEGKQREAEALAWQQFMSVPVNQLPYQPFVDLKLRFAGHEKVEAYRRALDLDQAVASVQYKLDGVTYRRQVFCSYPDQVLVVRLEADQPGKLTFQAALSSPHREIKIEAQDEGHVLSGQVGTRSLGRPPVEVPGAIRFEARLRAIADGGHVHIAPDAIDVKEATAVTLILAGATNFKAYNDVSADPSARSRQALAAAVGKSIDSLRTTHVEDHRKLFRRVAIDLGTTDSARLTTDRRLKSVAEKDDPALAALFFQYGRYLLIASSRPGSQPANLQGLWNESLNPPWDSKWTVNINTEMNYWPAEVTNLPECSGPLFDLIADVAQTGKVVAQEHYGARGWVLHHNTDIWRGAAPINGADHGIWVTGGAWLCHHLWDHYLYTGNRQFLAERAYPLMKDASLFFVDFLVEDPKTGRLISGPSNSPEQGGLVMGPTMDHQIIRDLFANTCAAAEILGRDPEFAARLKELLPRIAPNQVGRHGQLQEWLEDKDDPKNDHRHVSHLWGLYPGWEITPDGTPEIFKAARQSLVYRGDGGTGWSKAWKINLWARLLDGDHAHKMLIEALAGNTLPNLFDTHPPFQIDGNFGASSGIAEMLIQSQNSRIRLLPALPKAWPKGSVKGLRARGGYVVDLDWEGGKLTRAILHSELGKPCEIRLADEVAKLTIAAGQQLVIGPDLKRIP